MAVAPDTPTVQWLPRRLSTGIIISATTSLAISSKNAEVPNTGLPRSVISMPDKLYQPNPEATASAENIGIFNSHPPKAAAAKPAPKAATAPVTDENGGIKKPLGKIDDLKLIKGVGAVLEQRLNDAGIYHFWQIAKLRKAQMESLEGMLRFPGRMTRDNWKAQARALA